MINKDLAALFSRDIDRLKQEILAYTDETKLWVKAEGTNNPGGNLCMHLLGNLQHYIGAILGNTGYKRDRPYEFSGKHVPVAELVATIDHTKTVVIKTIEGLDETILQKTYPEKVFDFEMTTQYFLLHLLSHLNYHLGQINYHRRICG